MYQHHTITVENLKFSGCTSSLVHRLSGLDGVSDVHVQVESGQVSFIASRSDRDRVCETLQTMGYPERGTVQGMASVATKLRSFVSCALGKVEAGRIS
jgi:copper chaperone